MKKFLVAGLILLGACASARADIGVFDVMNDSFTITDVAISSHITGGTRQLFTARLVGATTEFYNVLENRKVIEIQNIDTAANVFCRVALSSTSAAGDLSLSAPGDLSTSAGRKIAAGGTVVWGLPARNQEGRVFVPWCVNDGAAGTVKLTITQGRTK